MQARKDTPMRQALSLYNNTPPLVRMHNYVRRATCPFDRIAGFVPAEGTICDLGCGHGLFSIYLALSLPCGGSSDAISRKKKYRLLKKQERMYETSNFRLPTLSARLSTSAMP